MKQAVTKAFEDERSRQSLKANKTKSLIDFITCLPQMSTKSCTVDNIQHGFFKAGYSDKEKARYPDMNKILATCRTDPTIDEYKLCEDK